MRKEFLPYDVVRNDALKLADKIYNDDGFVPDIIYCSLRGGAYMANVISEYYKIARKNMRPVLYAAVVARSYEDVRKSTQKIYIDGWTYPPENLRPGDKIMLVDDIFDTGNTINALVDILLDHGMTRENIKVVVHDYKNVTYRKQPEIVPDYYCRKFDISDNDDDIWIHYMSHELVGLEKDELENHYFKDDEEVEKILSKYLG